MLDDIRRQIVELIDYAAQRYPGRVKFLNFRQAHDLLNRHLLLGQELRKPPPGERPRNWQLCRG